jgi:hypothetical protein
VCEHLTIEMTKRRHTANGLGAYVNIYNGPVPTNFESHSVGKAIPVPVPQYADAGDVAITAEEPRLGAPRCWRGPPASRSTSALKISYLAPDPRLAKTRNHASPSGRLLVGSRPITATAELYGDGAAGSANYRAERAFVFLGRVCSGSG